MTGNNQKQTFILFGSVTALLGFGSKLIYRPWALENKIEDYGIAGSAPSFFYVMGACLLIAGFSQKHSIRNMVYAAVRATAYELEQYYSSMIFDFNDIVATGIGLGVAMLIDKGLLSKRKEELKTPVDVALKSVQKWNSSNLIFY